MLSHRLVAHRGFQHLYPENTLASIQGAITAGALNIELDVLFSSDGEAIIYHDKDLQRVSGLDKEVQHLPLEQLVKLPANEQSRLGDQFPEERIAPLSALLPIIEAHPQVRFFVEAKRSGLEFIGLEAALDKLTTLLAPVKDQVILISFHKEFAAAARQQGWLAGAVLESWNDLQHPLVQATALDYVFCNQRHIPETANLNQLQSILVVYEIGDPKGAIDWFRRGADMVETFNIGHLLTELNRNSL
ncbi:glycerophosphodiester phosphodiesterase family protein [Porticoccus sp. W117]|uniref:glycerophosphodiester phosphodiesterase family protein n=1 Tax=Porticoccus sp. W117 TaxID=3054777 RepID=UPI00259A8504|nr:glycerophosphodiester phosphodiesterase family protein [Porticoccus sp. W117]MDM3871193.1 glycerophosphodiester phosphodiesterase family protein [Porticoccus sp. W117]